MSRWWRAYEEAATDPKLQLLNDALFRAWFNLMCMASKNDGKLPPLNHVAYTLQVKPEKAAQILTELCQAGLLDKASDGFIPHNWDGRQYKSDVSTDRVKRFRNGQRNVSRNVSETRTETKVETPPETETETETYTEAEKTETRAGALVADDGWPADYREQFWNQYPNKVGKPKALAKLDLARKRGVAFSEIMDGLARYIASKPPDRAWLNPETFINQERWTDQPAQVENAKTGNIIQAADRLVDTVRLFDEGAGRFDALRGGESSVDVRLLSSR